MLLAIWVLSADDKYCLFSKTDSSEATWSSENVGRCFTCCIVMGVELSESWSDWLRSLVVFSTPFSVVSMLMKKSVVNKNITVISNAQYISNSLYRAWNLLSQQQKEYKLYHTAPRLLDYLSCTLQ